ncbi:MAG: hypothetical protein SGJ24_12250 [Chloroflexota bacterium]|nr:hypothetical protein [Chloroflexota bacterium]
MSTTDGYVRIWNASSLSRVDNIFIGNAAWAFDWFTDTEIVFATTDGELHIAAYSNVPAARSPCKT